MNESELGIAIIGLAGRFPNAADLEAFWELLKDGREALVTFSDEELLAAGVEPALLQHPDYVKAGTVVPDVEYFDASFFEMSARDAQITDPQQRLFMECVWEALEQAGYPPATTEARIGLYAGVGENSYQEYYLEPNMAELLSSVGWYRLFTLSGKDFIATRTAYKLNLTGPAVTVQTACSTSLVAVHIACQSLLNLECDMALAGGVSIVLPQQQGYLYQEGMIMSPDGHCRAFDAQAQGTTGGRGVGVVMLKRLDEALADGDTIHAVILGSAINNDGADKIGYTAPSVSGQVDVILDAQAAADVHPDQISYIEAHGTATPLGDPIEIQALTQAFRANTQRTGYCAIGSVKTNIGHADTAAGVAGLIKTVLALKHQKLPPSLHYQKPNPQIDFALSPFFVNSSLRSWDVPDGQRRCAGVSSFGIGGTNAHLIVAETPPVEASGPSRPMQLLTLSAKTESALESGTRHLSDWLQQHSPLPLPDVAYTLNRGRQSFTYRRTLVCSDMADAQAQFAQPEHLKTHQATQKARDVVFLFPGQGTQYPNMTRGLYETELPFQAALDQCARLLTPHLGQDLRHLLYSHDKRNGSKLKQTAFTQPALFAVEYALAKLWMAWGIQPKAMLGHSLGEYVAATLAGVFSLEDALRLVTVRGKLIQSLPPGAMLAVPLSEEAIQPWLTPNLSLAVVNGSQRCVVSGTSSAVTVLQQKLQAEGIECRKLHTSHAFHSHLMEPILAPFAQQIRQVRLHAPTLPYLSNLTGTWISPEQATDPDYWVRHLRHTVRFADNLQALFQEEGDLLLEVGPGQTLTALAQQHPHQSTVLYSLPRRRETGNNAETKQILSTLGQLWANGVAVDWDGFYAEEKRHRLPLPTYPFERQKYWIDAPLREKSFPTGRLRTEKPTITDHTQEDKGSQNWLYRPHWTRTPSLLDVRSETTFKHWLLFEDTCGFSQNFASWLKQRGHTVTTVQIGTTFEQQGTNVYRINPEQSADYEALVQTLQAQEKFPTQIVHCWSITHELPNSVFRRTDLALQKGFYSLLYLTQGLSKSNISSELVLTVISNQMQAVKETDWVQPEKALALGAMKTIEQEMDNIQCRSLDIELPFDNENQAEPIWLDLLSPINESVIAYRQGERWTQSYERLQWEPSLPANRLRRQGVYLITGGLGGIGLTLAEYLSISVQAKLVLVGRTVFPEKEAWQDWLASHDETDTVASKIRLLQALEQNGAEVLVYCADVADIEQMRLVIETTQQDLGPINGVIHAAGVPGGALIVNQDKETSMRVLAPKVTGTLVLEQLLAETQLDFFVLCSSLASITGTIGQIGYCAANAFQDAFAQAYRHPQTLFTAINWDTWQKVGMAVDAVRNLFAVAPGRQAEESPLESLHPLFSAYQAQGEKVTYISQLNDRLWVLNDHRIFGQRSTVMPGTAYLEWARAALVQHLSHTNVSASTIILREVYFLQPLVIENGATKTLHTTLTPKDTGYEFIISSQSDGDSRQEHARGLIEIRTAAPEQTYSIEQLQNRCQSRVLNASPDLAQKPRIERNALENALSVFGEHWHNLRQVHLGEKEGLAYLQLPPQFISHLQDYPLHPGLLDMATGFLRLVDGMKDTPSLPFFYESVTVYAPLTSHFYSYARLQDITDTAAESSSLDITLLDEEGNVLIEIIGYTLRKVTEGMFASQQMQLNAPENFSLKIGTKGILQTLTIVPTERKAPRANEVEIEVFAVSLNFKEVLYALGLLEPLGDLQFGLECAGRVAAVGSQVTDVKPGDKVVAFTKGGLSQFTITDRASVALQPHSLSFTEAATVPIAYVTAYYALLMVGKLTKGERVLIHSAAGGVGMAAVRIAQSVGAEILATAGNPSKREYLRSLGIQYVMDSRSTDFAEQIMTYTQGEGVNVVLNSLGGELMLKSLEVLAPFGRFLELGVRDIYSNTKIGLKFFANAQTYSAIQVGPPTPGFQEAFRWVMSKIESNALTPLPFREFKLSEIRQAFEYMSNARHIGRVVVSVQEESAFHRISRQPDMTVEQALSHGLLPKEGVAVFEQVLQHDEPQVITSKQGLMSQFQQIKKFFDTPAIASIAKFPRPALAQPYVAPRTALEENLTEIWQALLGITPVGVEDDFFELGGDSLLAVQFVSQIRQTLQPDFSWGQMSKSPTIRGILQGLNKDQTALTSFVPLRTSGNPDNGNRPPLFLTYAADGLVFLYANLLPYLSSTQPVYALQARGIYDDLPPFESIEALATATIREMKTIQPEGPYAIGGWSFGGLVAFEIARQLMQEGDIVSFLGVMDIYPPTPDQTMRTVPAQEMARELLYLLGDIMKIDYRSGSDDLFLSALEHEDPMDWLVDQVSQLGHQLVFDPSIIKRIARISRHNIELLMQKYQPQRYEGTITLFRAKESAPKDGPQRWQMLTPHPVDAIWVNGDHNRMMNIEHVEKLGRELENRLQKLND